LTDNAAHGCAGSAEAGGAYGNLKVAYIFGTVIIYLAPVHVKFLKEQPLTGCSFGTGGRSKQDVCDWNPESPSLREMLYGIGEIHHYHKTNICQVMGGFEVSTGEMTERPKVHDWKSCVPGRVPRVQIPLSPKNLFVAQKLFLKFYVT
jgi:hypothetical protein